MRDSSLFRALQVDVAVTSASTFASNKIMLLMLASDTGTPIPNASIWDTYIESSGGSVVLVVHGPENCLSNMKFQRGIKIIPEYDWKYDFRSWCDLGLQGRILEAIFTATQWYGTPTKLFLISSNHIPIASVEKLKSAPDVQIVEGSIWATFNKEWIECLNKTRKSVEWSKLRMLATLHKGERRSEEKARLFPDLDDESLDLLVSQCGDEYFYTRFMTVQFPNLDKYKFTDNYFEDNDFRENHNIHDEYRCVGNYMSPATFTSVNGKQHISTFRTISFTCTEAEVSLGDLLKDIAEMRQEKGGWKNGDPVIYFAGGGFLNVRTRTTWKAAEGSEMNWVTKLWNDCLDENALIQGTWLYLKVSRREGEEYVYLTHEKSENDICIGKVGNAKSNIGKTLFLRKVEMKEEEEDKLLNILKEIMWKDDIERVESSPVVWSIRHEPNDLTKVAYERRLVIEGYGISKLQDDPPAKLDEFQEFLTSPFSLHLSGIMRYFNKKVLEHVNNKDLAALIDLARETNFMDYIDRFKVHCISDDDGSMHVIRGKQFQSDHLELGRFPICKKATTIILSPPDKKRKHEDMDPSTPRDPGQ